MATTVIYTIESTDGGATLVIQPRTINGANGVLRNTDLTLYGNATPNWGERFNENFYRVTENFACEEKGGSPGVPQDEVDFGTIGLGVNYPLQGQLWFNKTDTSLYYQITPTLDVETLGAAWTKVASDADLAALESVVDNNKVDRAGDLNLTGVHGYPSLFFNEGNGAISVGPDVRMDGAGLISASDSIYLNVDGNNSSSGGLFISKGSLVVDGSETNLFVVNNNGLVEELIDPTTYSGLVSGGTDQAIPNRKYVDDEITAATAGIGLPPGVILPYGGIVAPSNFVMCDGSLKDSIADTSLAGLYAVIGISFGGTGPDAFNVPDMRGNTAVGIGSGSFSAIGQLLGSETHALTDAENGPHTHTGTVTGSTDAESSHNHGISWSSAEGGGGDNEIRSWTGVANGVTGPGSAHSHTITGATVTINPSGAGTPHNNIQPSVGVNYIISI